MKDVEKTWWTDLVCQQEEKSIQNTESMLSEVCHIVRWNHSELTKDKSSYELIKIHKTKESADFLESSELLSTIHCMALLYDGIPDTSYTQKWRISLKCKTEEDLCES